MKKITKRGRPPKQESQRKDVDLRIPVTTEQKQTIKEAVEIVGVDLAAWARPILLKAAEEILKKHGERGNRTRRA